MIADASGFNVIITKDIKELPPLTLNLTNIPWDQAFRYHFEYKQTYSQKKWVHLINRYSC